MSARAPDPLSQAGVRGLELVALAGSHGWSAHCSEELTFSAANESSPEVGSSRKRSLGLPSSSQPMLSRFFSPPLSPLFFASPEPAFMLLYLGA